MADARNVAMKVSLTDETFRRLKVVSERQGLPHSVVAAIAIGQYVAQHYGQVEMVEKMAAMTEKALAELPKQLELLGEAIK